jgi:hypothetical protein
MRIVIATLIVIAIGLGSSAAQALNEVTLSVADRTNTAPWLAASGRFVAVVWGAVANDKGDIMLAVSRDGGQSFGVPVRVNAVPGDARLNGELPPRVALMPRSGLPDPIITVLWNAKDGGTQIKSARSRDGGRTFGPPIRLQAAGAPGDRGWHALTTDGRGVAHAIWLDHRAMAVKEPGAAPVHKGEHDGVAMAQKSALYYAAITETGPVEREILKGVCYCCKTALATGPKGEIFAAWRHVFAGNFRDMGFTVSRDGGKSFAPLVRVSEDGWSINGCPDDGPAMSVDAAGTVHLVWPTVIGGAEGAILYATSRDGRAFSKPIRIPTLGSPKPSHPQIVVDRGGGVAVAWDEFVAGRRVAAVRRVAAAASGTITFGNVVRLSDDGASTYPVLAATNTGILAVWATSGDRSVVKVRPIDD